MLFQYIVQFNSILSVTAGGMQGILEKQKKLSMCCTQLVRDSIFFFIIAKCQWLIYQGQGRMLLVEVEPQTSYTQLLQCLNPCHWATPSVSQRFYFFTYPIHQSTLCAEKLSSVKESDITSPGSLRVQDLLQQQLYSGGWQF